MAITALPTPPLRSDPTNFAARGDAFLSALPTFVTEANATAAAMNLNSTTDTSASSVLISTGAKTFVVSAGKSFQPGMYLVIADAAAPSTNSVFGQVTSYSGTSLVMNILTVRGSGTYASWVISQASAGGAAAGANTDITSLSGLSGNINFTGTANRITGDFSNATVANRVMFQSSVVNSVTTVRAIPNGSGATASLQVGNNQDPNNQSTGGIGALPTEIQISSGANGTGTYLPLTFYTSSAERMRIDANGNVLVTGTGGLGYGTGAGGTVTQATSKATAVTLNKPTGTITMNAASLAAGATTTFLLNNSVIAFADVVVVSADFTGGNYQAWTVSQGAGNVYISVKNNSAGALTDAVVLHFAIIKGATS